MFDQRIRKPMQDHQKLGDLVMIISPQEDVISQTSSSKYLFDEVNSRLMIIFDDNIKHSLFKVSKNIVIGVNEGRISNIILNNLRFV